MIALENDEKNQGQTGLPGTPRRPSRLRRALAWCRELPRLLTRRSVLASAGVVASAAVALFLSGITTSPEQRIAATGEDLFEEIMAQHPDLREGCRIAQGDQRGTATNRMVLPDEVWDRLAVDQRNSLGTWLDTIGGSWEIRVGPPAPDGKRVRDSRPLITSRDWNRQLK
jgi:hypothetical protein